MTQSTINALPQEMRDTLDEWLGPDRWSAEPLHGDASVRAYYRVEGEQERYILAYYPPAVRPALDTFVRAYEAISPTTRVPRLIRAGGCAVLQADVGDDTLFDLLNRNRERGIVFYEEAIDLLVSFQQSPSPAAALNPPFDSEKFGQELEMTLLYYVAELRAVKDPQLHEELRAIFHELSEKVAGHPFVLCHRDYHGQNLHVNDDTLYMIDYQDLRLGPDTYDVASLLRDRGIAPVLGRKTERDLLDRYREKIGADVAMYQRYDECLLQRTIKILGTFAAQAVTRDRTHYLDYIPPALQTLRECVARLPQFERLTGVFPMAE